VCASLASAATPPAPVLAETFSAAVAITIKDAHGTHSGKGVWAVDQPGNMGLEKYEFDDTTYNMFELQRYDLGEDYSYQLAPNNKSECHKFGVSGAMPKVWSWVSLARYVGLIGQADVWLATIGYATMTLGVSPSDANIPLYMIRSVRNERESNYTFQTWNTTSPSDKTFTVPSICDSASASASASFGQVGCVAGATAVANAKVWVAAKVPYNQGGTYQGYREDCSGYVSMAWESDKPGHTTETMNQIAHSIAKDDLAPGDCLLYAAEHVVLFGGWTNSDKSEYQAYEETKPGEGTVTRPTPYPYWYSQSLFIPFRYNEIC